MLVALCHLFEINILNQSLKCVNLLQHCNHQLVRSELMRLGLPCELAEEISVSINTHISGFLHEIMLPPTFHL